MGTKINYLFLVGVEGCGHHMIRSLLHQFLLQDKVIDQGNWHKIFLDYFGYQIDNRKFKFQWFGNKEKNSKFVTRLEIEAEIRLMMLHYEEKSISHLFDSASYPYGNPRNTLRRFDILEILELLQNYVNLRILVLTRNPISATYSGFQRGFTKNIMLQAKIIEDNLIYLNSQLKLCSKDLYKILNFEDFLAQPKKYLDELSRWWNINKEDLIKGLMYLENPTQLADIPDYEREMLDTFFTEQRQEQWALLNSNKNNLLSVDLFSDL